MKVTIAWLTATMGVCQAFQTVSTPLRLTTQLFMAQEEGVVLNKWSRYVRDTLLDTSRRMEHVVSRRIHVSGH